MPGIEFVILGIGAQFLAATVTLVLAYLVETQKEIFKNPSKFVIMFELAFCLWIILIPVFLVTLVLQTIDDLKNRKKNKLKQIDNLFQGA